MDIPLILFLIGFSIFFVLMFSMLLSMFVGVYNGAPFVPTNKQTLKKLIRYSKIKPNDKVYDLGCGDGRLVFAAVDEGGIAVGLEISIIVCLWARIRKWFLRKEGTILHGDLFKQNLSDADLVFCYLLPPTMVCLEKKLNQELKTGARVVSHAFKLPNWKTIAKIPYQKDRKEGSVWVYEKN